MPTSVRLDIQTEALVNRLAKRRGQTKSEIIREALVTLAQQEEKPGHPKTPFEMMAPHLGCAAGGPQNLSEQTGRRFAKHLRTRTRS